MTITAVAPAFGRDLRAKADGELAEMLVTALEWDDPATVAAVTAECDRRDAAAKARKARQSDKDTWQVEAHAQYLAASASDDVKGCMFRVEYGTDAQGGPSDPMDLWTGSEAFARKYASEELALWWDRNGGRLSYARWRREQADSRRQARDERDAEAMAAGTYKPPAKRTRKPAPAPAAPVLPRTAPGAMARFIQQLAAIERQANNTTRALARVNGGIR